MPSLNYVVLAGQGHAVADWLARFARIGTCPPYKVLESVVVVLFKKKNVFLNVLKYFLFLKNYF